MSRAQLALIIALLLMVSSACDGNTASRGIHPPTEIGLLEDPDGRMDINQAASPQIANRYKTKNRNRISLGFNRSALWVRIPLDQAPQQGQWVLEVTAAWMDRVDLFLPKTGGGRHRMSTGLQQPSAANRLGVFALAIPDDTPRTGYAYLRLQSVLSLNAGLRIWSQTKFVENTVADTYLFGALYGVMGAMFLFNLLVLLTTRDQVYLMYILYLLSIIAHQLCLQGQVLFLPTAVWPMVPSISIAVSSSVFFFGAAFSRKFLNAKENAPLADILLRCGQAAAVVMLVLALTGQIWWGTWLVHSLALVGPLIAIAAGVKALTLGFRPARFYLLAWIVLLLGAMAWGAWSMGLNIFLLPRSLLTIAAAVESVLLSLALADRIRIMQHERHMLAQREQRYRYLSLTDELTGLFNSRYFWSKLKSEIMHAHTVDQSLGLVLLDVDDFKLYNDTHGHTEGDKVLTVLGKLLRKTVRLDDSPCRYGGEEFALILPRVDGRALREVSERARQALAQHVFQPDTGVRVTVTVSLGTAQLQPGEDARSLVKRADQALYEAKAKGKNQTIASSG